MRECDKFYEILKIQFEFEKLERIHHESEINWTNKKIVDYAANE